MTNRHRDLSLERSKFAWECATQAKTRLRANYKEYVTLVKNIPTSLSNNGLGQTLAFLNSKPKSDSHNILFNHLEEWLKTKIYQTTDENSEKNIIQRIQDDVEIDRYRWATREITKFITWLKLHSNSLDIDNRTEDKPASGATTKP